MSFATVWRGNLLSPRELFSGLISWFQSGDKVVIPPRGVNDRSVDTSLTLLPDEEANMEHAADLISGSEGVIPDAGMSESNSTLPLENAPKEEVASPPEAVVAVNTTPEADAMTEMRQSLFQLLRDVQLGPDGFNIAPALHRILCDVNELGRLCAALVTSFVGKSTQPITAVIGLGACGSVLAHTVARCLPPSTHSQGSQAVVFLPMERKSDGQLAFVDMTLTAKMLRGKQVLIVTPILTPTNVAEIQDMIAVVEGNLNANVTVHSVVTLLSLGCCEMTLKHTSGKNSLVKRWNGLEVKFGT